MCVLSINQVTQPLTIVHVFFSFFSKYFSHIYIHKYMHILINAKWTHKSMIGSTDHVKHKFQALRILNRQDNYLANCFRPNEPVSIEQLY